VSVGALPFPELFNPGQSRVTKRNALTSEGLPPLAGLATPAAGFFGPVNGEGGCFSPSSVQEGLTWGADQTRKPCLAVPVSRHEPQGTRSLQGMGKGKGSLRSDTERPPFPTPERFPAYPVDPQRSLCPKNGTGAGGSSTAPAHEFVHQPNF
jgi:hypothetical protein